MKRNNYIEFNRYLAQLVRKLGNHDLAKTILQYPVSLYEDWQNSSEKEIYFRRFSKQSMPWRHRRIISNAMWEGPSAIKKLARQSRNQLEKLIVNYFETSPEDFASIVSTRFLKELKTIPYFE